MNPNRWRDLARALAVLALCAGCSRSKNTIALMAPFNESTKVGDLTATWEDAGDERSFAEATRLDEPEMRFRYRLDARNTLNEGLFVRIGNFQLVDSAGLTLATGRGEVTCTLNAGTTEGVLSGDLWVPKRTIGNISGFRVSHFAVPLSERGRSLYREWLLQGRAQDAAQIDAEIARYAAAAPCVPNGSGG